MKTILLFTLLICLCLVDLSSAAILKKEKAFSKKKNKCTNNCKNPVYLISKQTGLTLDFYNDPTADPAGYSHYSYVKLTNQYNTWCIQSDGTIQNNQNNMVLVYLGTLMCGATEACGWEAQIMAFPVGQFPSQDVWQVTKESTGYTSIKETITDQNGIPNPLKQGWLVSEGLGNTAVSLFITTKTDISAQWILSPAPTC